MSDFSLQNPAIIQTKHFSDGEFFSPGNIILGLNYSREKLLSFNIQPINNGSFCSLFEWNFHYKRLSNPFRQFLLFSSSGKISSDAEKFELSLIEISEHTIKYVIFGKSIKTDQQFLYITVILSDQTSYNFSFTTNDDHYAFDMTTSLLLSHFSIAIDCVSSIKLITLNEIELQYNQKRFKTTLFDIEQYLTSRLQSNMKNVEFYDTSIIGKDEKESSFFVFIGFAFYHEIKTRWVVAYILINLPSDGRQIKQLHQDSVSFERRPQGNIFNETIDNWKKTLLLSAKQKPDSRLLYLTNKNIAGIDTKGARLIKIPECNMIIVDERNGVITF